MKRTTKITFCGMMSALATALMLFSHFPYLTYAIPAVAGLFIMLLVIETDCRWAFLGYLVSSVLVFLFAELESKLMYVGLFGYYPIIKALIERIRKPVFEWTIKLLCFFAAVSVVYFVLAKPLGVDIEDFGILGNYGAVILLIFGAFVFVLYDIAVSRMAMMYIRVLQSRLRKILK